MWILSYMIMIIQSSSKVYGYNKLHDAIENYNGILINYPYQKNIKSLVALLEYYDLFYNI